MKTLAIELTVKVTVQNPKLQSSSEHKMTGMYFVEHIVGMFPIPNPKEKGPVSQVLTSVGPIEVYESCEEIVNRINGGISDIASKHTES